MKHIKLFESMNDEMQISAFAGSHVTCISGDNGSAVGMLDPEEEKMLASYLASNPGALIIQKFPLGDEGDFVVLTGNGEWVYIKVGDTYDPGEEAYVYPILGFGQMFAGFAGAQTTWTVGSLSELLGEL